MSDSSILWFNSTLLISLGFGGLVRLAIKAPDIGFLEAHLSGIYLVVLVQGILMMKQQYK